MQSMDGTLVLPRNVPTRDSKYMGEAWMKAAFSKDPSTQVGAVIVNHQNVPLGSGYNGPPAIIDDDSFSWSRPSKDQPDAFSKYDVIIHAEMNAIRYSSDANLQSATLYVTALPCPDCMLEIVARRFLRVVYYDFQSSSNSSLQNTSWRETSFRLATMGGVRVDRFDGDLSWITEWAEKLKSMGILPN